VRDQQDLDIRGHKILKLSDVEYKINGMYIEIRDRNTRISKQQETVKNEQANSRKNQMEV